MGPCLWVLEWLGGSVFVGTSVVGWVHVCGYFSGWMCPSIWALEWLDGSRWLVHKWVDEPVFVRR